jgi:uncharacterized membrane protein
MTVSRYSRSEGPRYQGIRRVREARLSPSRAATGTNTMETGSFILIDQESCDTVGMGIVETIEPGEAPGSSRRSTRISDLISAAETHARSVAKAISWRATGSLDTFVLAAVITGSSTLAGGVALAEVLTKTILYYVHERFWALIPWGRR